jgi:hypothetical protein
MTASTTGARASRRAAATAARQGITAQPQAPEVLQTVMPDADEAFGPDDIAPQSAANPPSGSQTQGSTVSAPTNAPVKTMGVSEDRLALPQVDLTRQIDAGDLIIPKLRLTQAMSKTNLLYQTSKGSQGVQQGNWCHSQSNENLGETVFFIPVDMRKSRALFVQGQGLMCRSFDLLNGEGDPGGSCQGSMEEMLTVPAENRGCPLRLWNDKQPPKCGMTYNFVGLIIRESEIEDPSKAKPLRGVLQLRSASTGVAKQINTYMVNEGQGVWHNIVLELGVEVKTNPRGTFYVPTVDFYDTTDAEGFGRMARQAASMARSMGNMNLRSSLEEDGAN